MSSPDSPSSSHPARAAGFALLGVALIALVIGVFTLFGGGDGDQTATGTSSSPPPVSGSPAESASATPPATTEQPSVSTPAPTTTDAPPPVTSAPVQTAPATPPEGQPTSAKPPVRIYNNSTISGLAAKATDDVKRSGWDVAETGNYSQGQIPTTTVYYRPGTDEEESAKALAAVMQARVEARFDGIEAAHAGIIVIVTNDYKGPQTAKK